MRSVSVHVGDENANESECNHDICRNNDVHMKIYAEIVKSGEIYDIDNMSGKLGNCRVRFSD